MIYARFSNFAAYRNHNHQKILMTNPTINIHVRADTRLVTQNGN